MTSLQREGVSYQPPRGAHSDAHRNSIENRVKSMFVCVKLYILEACGEENLCHYHCSRLAHSTLNPICSRDSCDIVADADLSTYQ